MKKNIFLLLLTMAFSGVHGQDYKNPNLPVATRVGDLLSRMTPEEKFWQLFMIPGDPQRNGNNYYTGIFGFQVNAEGQSGEAAGQMLAYAAGSSARTSAIRINEIQRLFMEESRLGIPIIPFDEALHGLVRTGATAFPQSIGLAATWNTGLMQKVAGAIADECRARGIRQILSPVVNIASDVRWGRTEETYGEDPFLVSEMGVAYVSAFEKRGVITSPKHFVANVADGGRDSYPVHWNERLMREIYLPPFEACFTRGGSRSVMTSYNSYDGTPCTAHPWLLNQLLRNEWGFDGFVISDAGGTGGANVLHFTAADYPDAGAKSIEAGLDVIFQTNHQHYTLFSPPYLDGTIAPATIDKAVARVLKLKFELGLFENPYTDPELAMIENGHPVHRELAWQAAAESAVLLKNDHHLLPLSAACKTIAVIGTDAVEARLGGYSGPGNKKTTILNGIKNRAGHQVAVNYSPGCGRENTQLVTVPSEVLSWINMGRNEQGLKGEYYNNVTFAGEPVFTRTDRQIDFQWTLFSPDAEKLSYDFYSVRWSGTLTAPETGTFRIGVDGNDGYRLYIGDKLVIDNWQKCSRKTTVAEFDFEKGKPCPIRIEFYEPTGNAWFRLVWDRVTGEPDAAEAIEKAVALAAESDVAVVVAGIEEGEFRDRAYLSLPGRQEELIERVAATGTPVVVILVGGSAITMNRWIDGAKAILDVWYPGEEGGNAVAAILFGDYNPAGRLPITFPVFEGQLPLVYNHKPTGRGDDYTNLTGQPLFPFGFGLSYTSFDYTGITLDNDTIARHDSTRLTVTVKNTGTLTGDEVVQLYLRDELASVARPVTELKGFQRIRLEPGESRQLSFTIGPSMLSMLDANLKKVVEPGKFRLMVGASSKDIRQRAYLMVSGK